MLNSFHCKGIDEDYLTRLIEYFDFYLLFTTVLLKKTIGSHKRYHTDVRYNQYILYEIILFTYVPFLSIFLKLLIETQMRLYIVCLYKKIVCKNVYYIKFIRTSYQMLMTHISIQST